MVEILVNNKQEHSKNPNKAGQLINAQNRVLIVLRPFSSYLPLSSCHTSS